jgi:hypothetical protein
LNNGVWSAAVSPPASASSLQTVEAFYDPTSTMLESATLYRGLRINAFDVGGTNGDEHLYLALSRDGGALDSAGTSAVDDYIGYPMGSSCAGNGDVILCASTHRLGTFSGITVHRVGLDGGRLDDAGIDPSITFGGADVPVTVPLGAGFLVVWAMELNGQQYDVFARQVGNDGTLDLNELRFTNTMGIDERGFAAAATDAGVLIAWSRSDRSDGGNAAVELVWLGLGTATPLPWPSVSGAGLPALSSHDDRLLLAAEAVPPAQGIEAMVLYLDGGPRRSIFRTTSSDHQPSLAAVDDRLALLAWNRTPLDGGDDRLMFVFLEVRGDAPDGGIDGGDPSGSPSGHRLGVACACQASECVPLLLGLLMMLARRRSAV